MDATRFLIIGAAGQLGLALGERFPDAIKTDRGELDITDWESVKNFDWSRVDVILNAAAYTNVDGAETPEGRKAAWQVNATATGYLAKIASEHNITLVHVSTDYVFDGTAAPHTETEAFSPLGVYAQSKAAGDIAASVAPKYYVLRTSWVIGEGNNFVRTMIGLAAKNVSPTVVSDQIGRLTFTVQLVDAVEHLLKIQAEYGTYNVSNGGDPASWADITRTIFSELGRTDLTVTDTTTAEYFKSKPGGAAPRPLQSALDLSKIQATGLSLSDWRTDLHSYIISETKKEQ
ncbi:MAG TPA: NAD(P)-dependent oxidoreductase [Candidatus Saccharimonadales bacterium]|nr:NAD(P)-dependent oxidoreductase [Candidatus Saccharimonadales bacterium]